MLSIDRHFPKGNPLDIQIWGGIAALISAASWALCAILWRNIGETISPLSMNLYRGVISCLFLTAALLVLGPAPMSASDLLFLGLSGVLGIALGDTFFFMSLMNLGPRLVSLMGTLTPVLVTLLAVTFLGEKPTLMVIAGMVLTVAGIIWVLREKTPRDQIIKNKSLGIRYGLLSMICMAAGVILTKIGVTSVPTMQATLIRLLGGVAGLLCWGCLTRTLKDWTIPFHNTRLFKQIFLVVLISTFGGFWLFVVALKYVDAAVAGTLSATTPLFVLPLAAIMLKEKISLQASLGAVIVVGGIGLIFMGN